GPGGQGGRRHRRGGEAARTPRRGPPVRGVRDQALAVQPRSELLAAHHRLALARPVGPAPVLRRGPPERGPFLGRLFDRNEPQTSRNAPLRSAYAAPVERWCPRCEWV